MATQKDIGKQLEEVVEMVAAYGKVRSRCATLCPRASACGADMRAQGH